MSPLIAVTLVCWVALELFLRVREAVQGKGRGAHDRGTRVMVALSLGVAIGFTAAARSSAPSSVLAAAGAVIMWLGLATRIWAVAALGSSFRTTVEVDPGQAVVSSGPYRWVRHPSYTGLLLIVAGFGLASGGALVLVFLLPLAAIVRRIFVEEAELERVLGHAYRDYSARTARLIPGLW